MTVDPYQGASNPSSRQVSAEPDPDAAARHGAFLRAFLIAVSAVAFVGGVRTAIVERDTAWRVAGGVVAAAGAPLTFRAARGVWRRVVQTRRLRGGRCVHCGYTITPVRTGVCPECGRDPFDEV